MKVLTMLQPALEWMDPCGFVHYQEQLLTLAVERVAYDEEVPE